MDELDGFFNGDDVTIEVGVDVVEQRGKGRRFTRSCGTGDEDEAGAHVAEFFDNLRHAELFDAGDFGRNQTEDGGEAVFLFEVVAAEAGLLVHGVGKVEVARLHVFFEGLGIADFGEQAAEIITEQDGLIGDG